VTTTVDTAPFIVTTAPQDGALNVPVTMPVVVAFDQVMNPASLDYTFVPDPGGWAETWNAEQTVVTLTHAAFDYSQPYTVTLAAEDSLGNPLVAGPVPNPWNFETEIGPAPFVASTTPVDEAVGVPITASLVVTFSESVVTDTLAFTVTPAVSGWQVGWDAEATILTLMPAEPLAYEQAYTVTVAVEDAQGQGLIAGPVPNPWSFTTTVAPPPFIVSITPVDGDVDVPITTSLVITFSEPVVTATLAYTASPDPGGWGAAWSADQNILTLTHSAFAYLQTYTATISVQDDDGQPLVAGPVPNPWSFTTVIGPAPYIVSTAPVDGAVGVPITASLVVTFSERVVTDTLALTVTPAVSGWQVGWDAGATVLTLTPVEPLAYEQVYTVTVAVEDAQGQGLAAGPVPNPWHFMTVIGPAPFIVNTTPVDGAVGVPIATSLVVVFSKPVVTDTLALTVTPAVSGWQVSWDAGLTVLTLTPAEPLAYGQVYTVTVAVEDARGRGLVAGPVPNPWSFTTAVQVFWEFFLPLILK
jgi:methionine-rich copper-binding protein CopC